MPSEKEWRDTYSRPGGISVCFDKQWLLNGCPKCGCKIWEVTSDCYAYCKGCSQGIPTDYPFTASGSILSILDKDGVRDYEEDL